MTRVMFGGALLSMVSAVAVAQPTSTSQSTSAGASTSRTQTLSGTVVQVDGNTVAVKMASGEVRMFTPPADRRFVVDGKELKVDQLQPGTRLKATVTETSTPMTDRTVQSVEGRVWYAAGPTVILTLPNGQNRMYTVPANSPVKFTDADGKPITVFDLRKDMNVKAVKITEAQRTELASNVAVTGTAPTAASAAAGAGGGGAAASRPAAAGTPAAASTGAAARPAAASGSTSASGSAAPARTLPKTATQLPLLGLTGIASMLAGLSLTIRRRRASR
jgi:LPXTG-motif cell wall-anchored protein